MSNLCNCPLAASLTEIPEVTCSENFGQIQKVAFQRLRKADGTLNKFATANDILLLASWTALIAAADGTKIVVSPYIQSPADEPGAVRETGGGNDDLGGIPEVIGREATAFTGVLKKTPQAVIKAMKDLICEAQNKNLGVFLFDENGKMEAIKGETAGDYFPIPIRSFFVSDKGHGNYEGFDLNNLSWRYPPNYSDDLVILTPTDFNPLSDLKPAS